MGLFSKNKVVNKHISEMIYDNDLDLKNVSQYNKIVFLDFGSEFCGPCKKYEKDVLIHLYEKYKNEIIIKTIDISKFTDVAQTYNIMSIPAQILIGKDGTILGSHIGYMTYDDTIKFLKDNGVEVNE